MLSNLEDSVFKKIDVIALRNVRLVLSFKISISNGSFKRLFSLILVLLHQLPRARCVMTHLASFCLSQKGAHLPVLFLFCSVFLFYQFSAFEIKLNNDWNINCNLQWKELWLELTFLSLLFLQPWLISFVCFFLYHQASRGHDPSKSPLFPKQWCPQDGHFGPMTFAAPPLISLHQDQTCSQYLHTQSGKLFLEQIFICFAAGLCHLTLFSVKVSAAFRCSFLSLGIKWSFQKCSISWLCYRQDKLASWARYQCSCTRPNFQKGLMFRI